MDDELILVKPSAQYKKQAINFINEVELVDIDDLKKYTDNYLNRFLKEEF